MTSLASRTIAALRANHDTLAALVPTLAEEQLTGPSGASEWTIAQALSHLGSGAEISRKPVAAAAGIPFDDEDNQSVWARWDGSTPTQQAAGFVEHDGRLLEVVEALTPEQLDSLQVDLGFLPAPVPLVVALGMRLNEVANHAWDVRVGVDPSATVDAQSAELLIELFGGPLSFLLGFSSKPDQVAQEVRLAIPGGGIEIIDAVTVSSQVADPTATFEGPAEAVVRLLSGRLRAPYDAGVSVTGNVTLDDLRRAFPGY
jgi:uncharacterized protein (TIGR03083 family)